MISKDTFFSKKRTLNFAGTLFELSSPLVMGILNVTPDSFYTGSRFYQEEDIVKRCEAILAEGGAMIDIGAYSSRPKAEDISVEEEMDRLIPALRAIRKQFPDVIISVDTFRADVAEMAVRDFGVQLINDISGGDMDERMFEVISVLKVPYVMMHMAGTPQTMQELPHSTHILKDVLRYFAEKAEKAKKYGLQDLIIDPGFGFGKTREQNYELLSRLDEFRVFELPVLVGLSRKSMIYKELNTIPENAMAGTIAANTLAVLNGADILRVHDVKEAVDTVKIVNAYKNAYL
jgi:dihydropteroate synthase